MYSTMEEIKTELRQLCEDYIDMLDTMRNENIISEEVYNECKSGKNNFLEME